MVMEKVPHIKEHLDKKIFDNDYELGTKFGDGTLLVYICSLEEEKTITIEKFFEICNKRMVKYEDFK